MEHFPRYRPFGDRWIPLTKASDAELWFSLICAWINGWAIDRDASELICHRAHYDVTGRKPYILILIDLDILSSYLNLMKVDERIYIQGLNIGGSHDDVIKWKHFPRYWPFVRGIHRSPVNSPPIPGEFPIQRPVTRSFDVFFDLRLNKRLSKQSRGWWIETLSRPLWRHCNVMVASLFCERPLHLVAWISFT